MLHLPPPPQDVCLHSGGTILNILVWREGRFSHENAGKPVDLQPRRWLFRRIVILYFWCFVVVLYVVILFFFSFFVFFLILIFLLLLLLCSSYSFPFSLFCFINFPIVINPQDPPLPSTLQPNINLARTTSSSLLRASPKRWFRVGGGGVFWSQPKELIWAFLFFVFFPPPPSPPPSRSVTLQQCTTHVACRPCPSGGVGGGEGGGWARVGVCVCVCVCVFMCVWVCGCVNQVASIVHLGFIFHIAIWQIVIWFPIFLHI